MIGKSWVFWLGLLVFAVGAFEVFTVTQYVPFSNYGYVVGIAFVLAGLYTMYSERNEPESPTETILL